MINEQDALPFESTKLALQKVIAKNLGTNDYTYIIEKGSNAGDNYIGVVFRVIAKRKTNSQNDGDKNELKIILKIPPQNPARREQFFARISFVREALVYEEILPLFMDYQQMKGICLGEGFYEVPECYGTVMTEFEEVLFFEDLKASGFEMFDRHKCITFEHVRLVMESLGKFHAISFAMKALNPEKIKPYTTMTDLFLNSDDVNLNKYFDALVERAKTTLIKGTDDELLKKMESTFANGARSVHLQSTNSAAAEPCTVICHGDCWNNNVLYKSKDNIPIEIRFIDFQITRYASPATDLSYFFFCCTTKEFRDQYYEQLIEIYHKSVSAFLQRFGLNGNDIFPFTTLQDHLRKFAKFGLMMATIVLPMFTTLQEDIPDLDNLSEQIKSDGFKDDTLFQSKKSDDVYCKRMRDLIVDMDRLGYI